MASKRRIRRKECERKKRYATREEGYSGMIYLKKNVGVQHLFNVWKCKFCGGWHVGHRPGRPISK